MIVGFGFAAFFLGGAGSSLGDALCGGDGEALKNTSVGGKTIVAIKPLTAIESSARSHKQQRELGIDRWMTCKSIGEGKVGTPR